MLARVAPWLLYETTVTGSPCWSVLPLEKVLWVMTDGNSRDPNRETDPGKKKKSSGRQKPLDTPLCHSLTQAATGGKSDSSRSQGRVRSAGPLLVVELSQGRSRNIFT